MKPEPTIAMIADAAARALENGHDIKSWPARFTAADLIECDADFEHADLEQLTRLVADWQRGSTS